MTIKSIVQILTRILRWSPLLFLGIVAIIFAGLSPRFFTIGNIQAILVQSSWLAIVALGMNFVLLTAGVDLSVGATMYLAAVAVSLIVPAAPIWIVVLVAALVGAIFGGANGLFVVRLGIPPFVATLATAFVGRGLGLFFSANHVLNAGDHLAAVGREFWLGVPVVIWFAVAGALVSLTLMRALEFGSFVRAIGADHEGARRAGVPITRVTWSVYVLAGAFAGVGGLISLAQTASVSPAFGLNAEFLAIAAAVLGGTSLFGGRGSVWGPIVGVVLITTVQDGMALINANPYAYPVTTGIVIFIAVALDSLRSRLNTRVERKRIRVVEPVSA